MLQGGWGRISRPGVLGDIYEILMRLVPGAGAGRKIPRSPNSRRMNPGFENPDALRDTSWEKSSSWTPLERAGRGEEYLLGDV